MEELKSLEQKAEDLVAQFHKDFLEAVTHYSRCGAVEEKDLDVAFLKCVCY